MSVCRCVFVFVCLCSLSLPPPSVHKGLNCQRWCSLPCFGDHAAQIDVAIDGADEMTPDLCCIKVNKQPTLSCRCIDDTLLHSLSHTLTHSHTLPLALKQTHTHCCFGMGFREVAAALCKRRSWLSTAPSLCSLLMVQRSQVPLVSAHRSSLRYSSTSVPFPATMCKASTAALSEHLAKPCCRTCYLRGSFLLLWR